MHLQSAAPWNKKISRNRCTEYGRVFSFSEVAILSFWLGNNNGVPTMWLAYIHRVVQQKFITSQIQSQQGNSVARDLPPTGSEDNTTFPLYPGTRIYISI